MAFTFQMRFHTSTKAGQSDTYLVSCSNLSKVGHVGNGPHWESFVNQTIVDKHVGHAKHCNSQTLLRDSECQYEKSKGSFSSHENHLQSQVN